MHVNSEREVKVIGYALLIAGLVCLAGLLLSGGCGRTGADTAGGNGERAAEQVNRPSCLRLDAGCSWPAHRPLTIDCILAPQCPWLQV